MMRYRLMTHRIPRTIRYRGRAYDSWQALADDYGLSVFCVRNRIDRGAGTVYGVNGGRYDTEKSKTGRV